MSHMCWLECMKCTQPCASPILNIYRHKEGNVQRRSVYICHVMRLFYRFYSPICSTQNKQHTTGSTLSTPLKLSSAGKTLLITMKILFRFGVYFFRIIVSPFIWFSLKRTRHNSECACMAINFIANYSVYRIQLRVITFVSSYFGRHGKDRHHITYEYDIACAMTSCWIRQHFQFYSVEFDMNSRISIIYKIHICSKKNSMFINISSSSSINSKQMY